MKSFKATGPIIIGAAFLVGVVGLYYGASARAFMWAMFLPVKTVQFFAQDVLHLSTERNIMFSLATGIPLTVWYWWLLLRGLHPSVRR
ncbi:MAG: hypothetical protein V1907_04230 [Candidatus Kerfeldbacteria bacterium]